MQQKPAFGDHRMGPILGGASCGKFCSDVKFVGAMGGLLGVQSQLVWVFLAFKLNGPYF